MVVDDVLLNLTQGFGARTDDLKIAAVEIEHIGRRIYLTQLTVGVKWVKRSRAGQSLGRYGLDDVSGDEDAW